MKVEIENNEDRGWVSFDEMKIGSIYETYDGKAQIKATSPFQGVEDSLLTLGTVTHVYDQARINRTSRIYRELPKGTRVTLTQE